MVVSLYVCQIPESVTKEDIIGAFSAVSGYIDTRIKYMPDKSKIAFIDFENEKNANFAKESLQGFKFTNEDKGIIIKFSENARYGKNRKNNEFSSKKRKRSLSNDREETNSINKNNTYVNNSSNNNNVSNNLIENLINNPLIKLIEKNSNNNNPILPNQVNSPSNLLKNLTLLAGINNNIQNSNININNNNNDNNINNDLFKKYEEEFYEFENLKKNATNIVYVEGIPLDATEREVAHIFRPFPGYKSLRLIHNEKNGENTLILFVDFENSLQSTICINTLQGYRFDKNDLVGLHCSYGINKNKKI